MIQADAPPCPKCETIMVRNQGKDSCLKCDPPDYRAKGYHSKSEMRRKEAMTDTTSKHPLPEADAARLAEIRQRLEGSGPGPALNITAAIAARSDLTWLLDLVERLQAELEAKLGVISAVDRVLKDNRATHASRAIAIKNLVERLTQERDRFAEMIVRWWDCELNKSDPQIVLAARRALSKGDADEDTKSS